MRSVLPLTRMLAAGAVIATLLAAVAAVFAWQARILPTRHRAYTEALLRAEDLDAQLDAEIARARLGRVTQYDGLVRLVDAQHTTIAVLRRPPPHADLDAEWVALEAAFAAKTSRLELFKTDHAVLRNSARLLPFLAERLAADLAPDDPLHDATNAAVAAVLGAAVDPDDARWDAARCALVPLGGPAVDGCVHDALIAPPSQQQRVDALVDHASEVVARHPVVDASVHALGDATVAARVRDLLVAYDRATQAAGAQQTTRTTWVGLWTVLAVLLAALAVISRLTHTAGALRQATDQLRQANGQLRRANEALQTERDRTHELAREVAQANDELEQANDRLAVANTQLAREAEQKSQFVSITSHEFRTPLTVIRQSAELLECYGERWGVDRRTTHLHRILGKSLEMEGMLEQLLVIGRADSGLLEVHTSPTVVGHLLDEVVQAVRAKRWEQRTIEVDDRTGPLPRALDQGLLKRALTNLLSNALKYSPDHSPVRLSARVDDGTVVFTVVDEGIGIPEADRADLFQPFQRCSNAVDFEGTGLGLAVVQRSVQVHGGAITLHSATQRGTRFDVRIPAHPVAAPHSRPAAMEAP